jgi:hypothetical protein
LDEAVNLMDMPFDADSTMWGALLGASRIHRNSELGRSAAKKIFELEPENAGMYVSLFVWGIISCVFLQPQRGWVYRVSYTPPPRAVWTTGTTVYKTGQQRKKVTHKPPPSQPQLDTGYVEAGPELREGRGRKTLGEDVSELGGGQYMENPNISNSHTVTNEVQVNLHMLRPLMLNRVGGEVHGADVVTVDECALGEQVVKLSQELSCHTRI